MPLSLQQEKCSMLAILAIRKKDEIGKVYIHRMAINLFAVEVHHRPSQTVLLLLLNTRRLLPTIDGVWHYFKILE